MSDAKKLIVDDDWKAEAQREKERLAQETQGASEGPLPAPSFIELVNLLMMQTLVGLGLVGGPGGERYPANPEIAKHYIDMLQMLEDKTRGNLNAEEKGLLDQALYEIRMRYVQLTGGGAGGLGGGVSAKPGGIPKA